MKVTLVNNDGGGLARDIENVQPGTTIEAFLGAHMRGFGADKHSVRINQNEATEGQELFDGDRVMVTPRKIAGA